MWAQILISNNDTPYNFRDFANFARTYGFWLITSSPYYPRENLEVETGAQTIKCLLKSNSDLYAALLSYSSTRLQNGFSPADLLMGRKLGTTLSVLPQKLNPKWGYLKKFCEVDLEIKQQQKVNIEKRHAVKKCHNSLPRLMSRSMLVATCNKSN